MMPGFKYPNARLDDDDNFEFIGCSILAAFVEMPGGWDYYNRDTEIIFEQTDEVERAAKFLAPVPSSCASRKTVYQKKEQQEHYWGKSQQLAVLLATIQCCRDVAENIQFGIWCTGEIEFEHDVPKLRKVGIGGFEAKLQAFLSEERYQNDKIFIVPQVNMTTRLESFEIDIISVAEFNVRLNSATSADNVFEKKTILMVGGDELLYLINTIFPLGRNPYKGLDSFEEEDSRFFFGREEETEKIWETYQEAVTPQTTSSQSLRFLAIVGASGSGKSSLARAGFLAKLDLLSEEERPLVIDCTPGSRAVLEEEVFAKNLGEKTLPLKNLAAELARIAPQNDIKKTTADELVTLLVSRDDGLSHFVKTTLQSPVVLFVDQCEELFSLEVADGKTQEHFITSLLHATSDPEACIFVLITIRPGFYQSKRKQYSRLLHDIIEKHKLHIAPMESEQLERVITEPARYAGSYQFDLRFVKTLVAEIKGSPGALPLLEVTLTRIWQELKDGVMPDKTYASIGGVVGALAHEADRVYTELSDSEQQIAQRAFLEMLYLDERFPHYGDPQRTRRRIRIADLVTSQEDWQTIHDVLQQFAQPGIRFVTFDGDRDATFVEVTHEAIFNNWERLEEWLEEWSGQEENRNDILFRQQVDRQITRWQAGNKTQIWQKIPWGVISRGLMWEKHDYNVLRKFASRHPEHMTRLRKKYYNASVLKHLAIKWLARLLVGGVFILALYSAVQTQKAKNSEEQRSIEKLSSIQRAETLNINAIETTIELVEQYSKNHDDLNAVLHILNIKNILSEGFLGQEKLIAQYKKYAQEKFQNILKGLYEKNRFVHTHSVTTIALTLDGTFLAFGDIKGRVYTWNLEKGTIEEISSSSHSGSVLQLCFSPDGKFLASAGSDGFIRVWNLSEDMLDWEKSHSSDVGVNVLSIDFSPDGKFLASAGSDGFIRVWNPSTDTLDWESPHSDQMNVEVFSIDFSPNGRFLAAAGKHVTFDGKEVGLLKVWNLADPQKSVLLNGHSQAIYSVNFSPDGKRLVSGGQDSRAILWNIDTGEQLDVFNDIDLNFVQSVAFSPDGQKVLAGSDDGTVRLFSLIEPGRFKLEKMLRGHDATVYAVQYHSNGMFASGSWDGTVRVWDTAKKDVIEQQFFAIFKLTEQSFNALKDENIPDNILQMLEQLKNQEFTNKNSFLHVVNDLIGEEQTVTYKMLILKHAEELKEFGCVWLQGYLQTMVTKQPDAQPEKDIFTMCNPEKIGPKDVVKQ